MQARYTPRSLKCKRRRRPTASEAAQARNVEPRDLGEPISSLVLQGGQTSPYLTLVMQRAPGPKHLRSRSPRKPQHDQ